MHERLLQPDESEAVHNSVNITRKMRRAALWGELTPQGYKDPTSDEEQEALKDAEALARITAQFLIAIVTSLSHSEQWDLLTSTRALFSERYEHHEPYSYSTDDSHTVRNLEKLIDSLSTDWEATVNHQFANKTNVTLPLVGILSPSFGVIAPLSRDFHQATIMQGFIENCVQPETFSVKPAAVQPFTSYTILPLTEQGDHAFQDKNQIAVYVDLVDSGKTARSLYKATHDAYPNKTVYSPVK